MKYIKTISFLSLLLFSTPANSSWNLVYDLSNETSGTFTDSWSFETGCGIRNSEQECYTSGLGVTVPYNVQFNSSGITITARKESDLSYTSGSFYFKTSYPNLRVQVIALMPEGIGLWPAIWFRNPNSSAGYGEIDIVERLMIGGSLPVISQANIWTGDTYGNSIQNYTRPTVSNMPRYVNYVAELTPDMVKIYYDGVLVNSLSRTTISPLGTHTPLVQSYAPIINLAVGGTWPGNVDDDVLPAQMVVRDIKIWAGTGPTDQIRQPAFKGNPNQLLH
jgi:beta-glucanase (GH16 family)